MNYLGLSDLGLKHTFFWFASKILSKYHFDKYFKSVVVVVVVFKYINAFSSCTDLQIENEGEMTSHRHRFNLLDF